MAPRRTSGAVRKEGIEKGAVLLKLPLPEDGWWPPQAGAHSEEDLALMDVLEWGSLEHKSALKEYGAMERKGYFVLSSGCILPLSFYRTPGEGATLKGHQRYFQVRHGFIPSSAASQGNPRTPQGWPKELQLSHTCHRRGCIVHVVLEWKWRNVHRNYCGYTGECDCSHRLPGPACVLPYRAELSDEQLMADVLTDRDDIETILGEVFPEGGFELLPDDYYQARDAKSAKRLAKKQKVFQPEAVLEELGALGEADENLAAAALDATVDD